MAALAALEGGTSRRQIAAETGVPVATIRNWGRGRIPARAARAIRGIDSCEVCGAEAHDFATLPAESYAYLLGLYLGDGCVDQCVRGTFALRLALDAAYPWIVDSAVDAVGDVNGRRPSAHRRRQDRCIVVTSYSRSWPCLLPQHGPGKKHDRRIALLPWQREIVSRAGEAFLRGLIHSDGWRGLNRVKVKGRWYAYPRYQFSNRSTDIRMLFTETCDDLGILWRPWGRHHISVARRESVARLDSFIGPKS